MARGRRARGPHRTARGDAAKGQSPPQKHVAPEGMEALDIAELVRDAIVNAKKDGSLEEALKEMSEVGADAFAAAASETTSGGQDSPSLVPGVGPSAESCSSGSTPEAEATGTELQEDGVSSLAADGFESTTWDKGPGQEKKVSERAVRRILKRYSEGLQVGGERPLSDEDDRLIRRVLQSHPKGVITDGAQVVRIMTRQLSSGTCFAAARSDGSVSEFAWRSCFKHEHRDYQAKAALQQKQPEQPNAGQAHCTMVQAPTSCTPLLHTPAPPPYSTLPLSYYAEMPTGEMLQHVGEMATAPHCGTMPPPNCYAAAMFAHPEMAAPWAHHLACGSEGLPSYGGKGVYGKPDHFAGQRHGPRGWKGHMGKNAYDMHGKAAGKGGRAPHVGSRGYPDTAASSLGNARSKRAALRALKQQQHQQYEKSGASRSAPGSGGQLHAGSIAGNEILGMLQQCGSGRRPRQVRGRWSEPQPLTTDEFLLVTVESREDAERNADKHNFDTFGEDAGPGGGAWDFESMMQANRSLVAEASVTHRRRQIMGYSASDQPVVFQ